MTSLQIGTIHNLNSVEKRHEAIDKLDLNFASMDDMKEYLNGEIVAVVTFNESEPIYLTFDQDFPAIKNKAALESARDARAAKKALKNQDDQVQEQREEQAA
jgi:hypothetical protein